MVSVFLPLVTLFWHLFKCSPHFSTFVAPQEFLFRIIVFRAPFFLSFFLLLADFFRFLFLLDMYFFSSKSLVHNSSIINKLSTPSCCCSCFFLPGFSPFASDTPLCGDYFALFIRLCLTGFAFWSVSALWRYRSAPRPLRHFPTLTILPSSLASVLFSSYLRPLTCEVCIWLAPMVQEGFGTPQYANHDGISRDGYK